MFLETSFYLAPRDLNTIILTLVSKLYLLRYDKLLGRKTFRYPAPKTAIEVVLLGQGLTGSTRCFFRVSVKVRFLSLLILSSSSLKAFDLFSSKDNENKSLLPQLEKYISHPSAKSPHFNSPDTFGLCPTSKPRSPSGTPS